jgi:hypothetical protein
MMGKFCANFVLHRIAEPGERQGSTTETSEKPVFQAQVDPSQPRCADVPGAESQAEVVSLCLTAK